MLRPNHQLQPRSQQLQKRQQSIYTVLQNRHRGQSALHSDQWPLQVPHEEKPKGIAGFFKQLFG